MTYHETSRQFIDVSGTQFNGRVLDIGSGGEGVILRLSGDKVVAIDISGEELAETPDIGLKVVMDACQLRFLNNYFDNVTCFYSLMYMSDPQIKQFLDEAHRVMKTDARLWIWDAVIPAKTADVFITQLEIKLPEQQTLSVGYGVSWTREQSIETIRNLCINAGFACERGSEYGESFSLCMRKNHESI